MMLCASAAALMELRDLPAGELTLSFEILSTTGSYAGNYGYFKICRPGDIALDVSAEASFPAVPNAHYVSLDPSRCNRSLAHFGNLI